MKTKRPFLAAAAAALSLAALTGCSLLGGLFGGDVSDDGNTSVFDLRVGDCINDTGTQNASAIASLDTVPCSEPHDFEVYALLDFTGRSEAYPGDETIDDWTWEGCYEEFGRYTGIIGDDAFQNSDYDIYWLSVNQDGWNFHNDRGSTCMLMAYPEGKLTGSAKR